jgi:hypothetical protein
MFWRRRLPAWPGIGPFCTIHCRRDPFRESAMSQPESSLLSRFSALEVVLAMAALAMVAPLIHASQLLNDPDTLWHLHYGQEWLRTGVFPQVDSDSFTANGLPWITKEWLSQVILALVYGVGGWPLLVVMTAACVGASMIIVGLPLARRLPLLAAVIILAIIPIFWAAHLLVRPHVLAFPVLALWIVLLVRAADRLEAPHPAIALLMMLWANLHGGFTLGFVLAAGLAAESVLHAPAAQRVRLAKGWAIFGGLTLLAAICTPFGVDSLLVTRKIFALGSHLTSIQEWEAFSFQTQAMLGITLLAGIGALLILRPRFRAARIALMLFVLYLALTYSRNLELLALVMPSLLAGGLAARLATRPDAWQPQALRLNPVFASGLGVMMVGLCGLSVWLEPKPRAINRPEAALAFARDHGLDREPVFNDYGFGGYLITQDIKTFVDGRAELFPRAVFDDYNAVTSMSGDPLETLDRYRIGWILLPKGSPTAKILTVTQAWTTIYQDDVAMILVKAGHPLQTARR